MADTKSDEKFPLSLEKTANSEPIAESLNDSDLEDVSGGSGSSGETAKNTICGSNC
jgi:hypothetical protein